MHVLVYNSSGLVLSFITFTMVASEPPHHYRFVHSSVEFKDLKLKGLITPLSTQLNYDYWSCVRMLSVSLILKLTCLILA